MTTAETDTNQVIFDKVDRVPLDSLIANPWQPRQHINLVELVKLAENIRKNGLMHPIIVRPDPEYNGKSGPAYQIAAGERRWRAFMLLYEGYNLTGPAVEDAEGDLIPAIGQTSLAVDITLKGEPDPRFREIPVSIRKLDDAGMMQTALGENGQRSDITAMEEAIAFAKMIERLGGTQADFGKRMGLSQSHIANRLRMLKLPMEIRHHWIEGALTNWHAIKLLELQNKFNLTYPYLSFLAAAFDKNKISASFLDDGLFEDRISAIPGGRDLLQDYPLAVQIDMFASESNAQEAAPAPAMNYPKPAAAPIPTPARPLEEENEDETPVTRATPNPAPPFLAQPTIAPAAPAPAPTVEEAPVPALSAAAQAVPNFDQARKDAAAQKFNANYSSKYLVGQPPAAPDKPTCRFLARMVVINTYLRMSNPSAFVLRMQSWLRLHNLSDDLEPFHPSPLPVAWIDRMLESFGEEFYRNPEVVQAAVALTTECALQTGDFNNSLYQAELYYYIRSALNEAAEKAKNEIPEFK